MITVNRARKFKLAKTASKSSAEKMTEESRKRIDKKSTFDWISTVFKLSAFFVFCVYLYGYGATVGYAEYFRIPQSALYSSPTDLLGIASDTFLYYIFEFFKLNSIYSFLLITFKGVLYIALLYGLAFALLWFAAVNYKKNPDLQKLILKIKNLFFPNAKVHLKESNIATALRSIWHGFLFFISFSITQFVLLYSIFAASIVILIIAICGYFAATSHAEREVIRPEKCEPMQSRLQLIDTLDKREAAKQAGIKPATPDINANCIKVTFTDSKGSKTIAGRSVLAGSEYILVYETTGNATRIPIKTAVIEAADDAVLEAVTQQNAKLLTTKAQ